MPIMACVLLFETRKTDYTYDPPLLTLWKGFGS